MGGGGDWLLSCLLHCFCPALSERDPRVILLWIDGGNTSTRSRGRPSERGEKGSFVTFFPIFGGGEVDGGTKEVCTRFFLLFTAGRVSQESQGGSMALKNPRRIVHWSVVGPKSETRRRDRALLLSLYSSSWTGKSWKEALAKKGEWRGTAKQNFFPLPPFFPLLFLGKKFNSCSPPHGAPGRRRAGGGTTHISSSMKADDEAFSETFSLWCGLPQPLPPPLLPVHGERGVRPTSSSSLVSFRFSSLLAPPSI